MTNQIRWSIDQVHSEISFKVRHLMISNIKGAFKIYDASIYTTGKDFLTAEIDLWINADSISTGNEKRDEDLRSEAFFDTKNYKQITFIANTIIKGDVFGIHEIWGGLTMRGVTKNIKLFADFGGIATDPEGHEKAGFTVRTTINRNDWGLSWNTARETGGLLVGEEVNISCELELINMGDKDLQLELESKLEDTVFY
jgi:polyisoprenoid-binding protein YceI